MKKRLFVGFAAVAACLVAVSAFADGTATAVSSSAIGVIKKTLPAGKRVLMSVPLDQESDTGDGFVFATVPAISNMPNGSEVYFWNTETLMWDTQTKTSRGGWGAQKNRVVATGESFFLVNGSDTSVEFIVSGEVPPNASISKAISDDGARNFIANPYPVASVLTNMAFASEAPNGSEIYFWDEDNQTWITQTKTSRGGWGTQKSRIVAPAEGFVLQLPADSSFVWQEIRPYTWPN